MKEKILLLRSQGKTYNEIKNELGCAKSTIAYYCGQNQKDKTVKRTKHYRDGGERLTNRYATPHFRKCIKNYLNRVGGKTSYIKDKLFEFTAETAYDKFGDRPSCYLTGRAIDWNDKDTYSLDHIIPVIKGGQNSLENLQLCHPDANIAKGKLDVDEFILLCQEVLIHNGFKVIKLD